MAIHEGKFPGSLIRDPEEFLPSPKPSLLELLLMSGMMQPYGSTNPLPMPTGNNPCGLRGKDWDKRKSRSKTARQSRKRNRK